jgi:hypothetical protein
MCDIVIVDLTWSHVDICIYLHIRVMSYSIFLFWAERATHVVWSISSTIVSYSPLAKGG